MKKDVILNGKKLTKKELSLYNEMKNSKYSKFVSITESTSEIRIGGFDYWPIYYKTIKSAYKKFNELFKL